MPMKPRASVIIPAYNAEKFIAEAIDSVLSQTHDNVECIVVDDGSSDRTAEIAHAFGERVFVISQENRKLPEARNTGIRHATGEYISFLDADDRIARTKIEHQLAYLQAHPDCGAVYSRINYFDEDNPGQLYALRRPTPQGDILDHLVYGNFIPVHSSLFMRRVVDTVVGFRGFAALEDWDFLLRLAVAGCRFGFLDEATAEYRMHAGGMSADNILMFRAKLEVISDLARSSAPFLTQRGINPEVVVNYHLADLGKALILHGATKEGVAAIREASRKEIPQRGAFLLFAAAARLLGPHLLKSLYELSYARRKRTRPGRLA